MAPSNAGMKPKLHGRAFYESIGSPKLVLAPMVDQSEFAWRMLSRSFMNSKSQTDLLAYSPMLHARMFVDTPKYRAQCFKPTRPKQQVSDDSSHQYQSSSTEPYLDGNPSLDRPLFVQFCANDPDTFLEAARHVQPFCDAVDLNLGCPQGIAKRGHYGSFLQEDWDLIYRLINRLHKELDIPVTAKMRILDTKQQTLQYAKMILSAGASIITVHGRRREQKGHNTGLADWSTIAFLRENLPPETVIFANGNILQHDDIERCLEATGADGVMSAEGNLFDPTIFSQPPHPDEQQVNYWRGRDGKGGYRVDAVMRRYMDIIYKYVLGEEPPARAPLFDPNSNQDRLQESNDQTATDSDVEQQPPQKKRKKQDETSVPSVNLVAMQSHLFNLLRKVVTEHTDIRDALARCRVGDIKAFEGVLTMVEKAVKEGLAKYKQEDGNDESAEQVDNTLQDPSSYTIFGSAAVIARCKRPWWVCQPHIRPSPAEALQKGALQLSKKEKKKLEEEEERLGKKLQTKGHKIPTAQPSTKVDSPESNNTEKISVPAQGLVCG